ncbi:hypothetical protein Bcep1808_7440 (plasmid) [Burkholderia vietnamiensis G4]|uniref:Uncharacterized protein n=1 Tax=Burkholderia vietnamiensis (strain G4 / LMG 22486) TaxID=269482 RepID=A4JVL4_BURVG|nr:hypothetical protein Bcep1808_7440 [Burkholderia vietnamiensis G4]
MFPCSVLQLEKGPDLTAAIRARHKLPAHGRTMLIDQARNLLADFADQRDAAIAVALHPAGLTIAHLLGNAVARVLFEELGPRVRVCTAATAGLAI